MSSVIYKPMLLILSCACIMCTSPKTDQSTPSTPQPSNTDNTLSNIVQNTAVKEMIKAAGSPEHIDLNDLSVIPNEEDWDLVDSITLEGVDPLGISYSSDRVFLSDTINRILLSYNLVDKTTRTILNGHKVGYLGQKAGRILVPVTGLDSLFGLRGEGAFYKFKLGTKLHRPIAYDGVNVKNIVVVDQGNHRLVTNIGSKERTIGRKGSGDGDFLEPTDVSMTDQYIYVVDAGNSCIKMFDFNFNLIKIIGKDWGVKKFSSMSNDGKFMFVIDEEGGEIVVADPFGELLYKLDIHINNPTDALFKYGKLYIADRTGATIKILENKYYKWFNQTLQN